MKNALLYSLLSALTLSTFGCAGTSDPSEAEATVPEGLSAQLDPLDANRVTGTYARSGHFITFELLAAPQSPNEMNMRIGDEFGQVMALQLAGDPPDSSWTEATTAEGDPQARALSWELVKELEPAIAALPATDGFYAQALAQLSDVSRGMRAAKPEPIDQPAGDHPQLYDYRHRFLIYTGANGYPVGNHSGTRREVYNTNGTIYTWAKRCNHGYCPPSYGGTSSTMSLYCTRDIWRSSTAWVTPQDCGTSYDYTSSLPNAHNCHDDTKLQEANFVYNTSYSPGGAGIYFDNCNNAFVGSSWNPGCNVY